MLALSAQTMLKRLRDWHGRMLDELQKRTGLSSYQILWLAFAEGLFFGVLLGWWWFLMNVYRRLFGLGLMFLMLMPVSGLSADTPQEPVRAALAQTGANVVFMRHALAPGYGDPDNFQIEDCNTQRNLDEAGRRQAEAIGRYFREHQITFTAILSSRWCRCTQTAELLNYGSWSEFDGLNSFFQGHVDKQETLALLRDKLDSLSSDDLVLMVTHQVVISAITDISPPSGGLVVYNTSTQNAKPVRSLTRNC